MRTFGNSGEKDISYKCVLKKDEPVIPIELLVPYVLKGFYPECEFLALPFLYEVDKYIEESIDENLGVKREPIVVMGNKKNISIKGLLEERIQELKRYIEMRCRYEK